MVNGKVVMVHSSKVPKFVSKKVYFLCVVSKNAVLFGSKNEIQLTLSNEYLICNVFSRVLQA